MSALAQITEEPGQLRRCVRDLLALNALPALWQYQREQQIAESTGEALVTVLGLEFVYISLATAGENARKEVVRVSYDLPTPATKNLRSSMARLLRPPLPSEAVRMANPLGAGSVQTIPVSMGLSVQEFLVAASKRPSFPDDIERLL